jgi:hypothetical protein
MDFEFDRNLLGRISIIFLVMASPDPSDIQVPLFLGFSKYEFQKWATFDASQTISLRITMTLYLLGKL